jgi:hypothetical protein
MKKGQILAEFIIIGFGVIVLMFVGLAIGTKSHSVKRCMSECWGYGCEEFCNGREYRHSDVINDSGEVSRYWDEAFERMEYKH